MANMTETTHASLTKRLANARSHQPTIANNTTVEREVNGDGLLVRLHGHVIAEVTTKGVHVTNAGYGTKTTRDRINSVLRDHGLPFYVAQRNHAQVLFLRVPVLVDGIGQAVELTREFDSLTVDMSARVYSVNGNATEGY